MSSDTDTAARAAAAALWEADVANRALGMELGEVRAGFARVRMEVTATMDNGHDLCHGGYVFTLADTAAVEVVEPELIERSAGKAQRIVDLRDSG